MQCFYFVVIVVIFFFLFCSDKLIILYMNFEHAHVQIYHAATFGHQPQPTFSSQTQAVALYPASTPALGPQAGPPPYPSPTALPLGFVDPK